MNTLKRVLPLLLICLILCGCGAEPRPTEPAVTTEPPVEIRDWAAELQPDMSSETVKQVVTVKSFVDGDTTHFYVPETVLAEGELKARYLGIDTPESTGKIEEFGKAASRFTKGKLEAAREIMIESDNGTWNHDSTGERYLVWVWYRPEGSETWRNLNIELLQEGLANPNSSARNRYGETCMAAIAQAKAQKLNLNSGQQDPDYYYGDAIELTLRELRLNIESYNGMKVAFEGVVTTDNDNSVYIESYDPDSDRWYGISAYYGFSLNGTGLDILTVGNYVRVVGTVQLYEAKQVWQVADLNYRMMQPDDPGNLQKISEGHEPAWVLTEPADFCSTAAVETEEGILEMPWAELALGTSLEMRGLHVVEAEIQEDSAGTMTLTCICEDSTIRIRTSGVRGEDGEYLTAEDVLGKTIDVKGFVDKFHDTYQIMVFTSKHITIH